MSSNDPEFRNRVDELEMLTRRWESGQSQIFTLWGRRRVGKSLLLVEFARGKRHLHFEATSGTRADQLSDFSDRLSEATGRAALAVPDWRAGLDAVADWAMEAPVFVVFDEFQYLARADAEIGSIINVWWRERGARLPIFLVLAGSEVGFFEREVVNYSATTYGRRAGQLRLRPFRARDVGLFVPEWSVEDRVRAYAVFGHLPYYLAQIRPERTLAENILSLMLMPDGLLREEARLLLDQELNDASSYFSVLRAIAAGQTRVSRIAERTGVSGGTSRVSQMLEVLQRLWLVDKQFPVTVMNPERSRQSFYRIADPYLRFWFRFVLPSQGRLIDPEGARRHLEARVLPSLDHFVSAPAFEEVCHEFLLAATDAAAVGWWWGTVREMREARLRNVERELDAVAIDDDGGVLAVGSCKWTAGPMPFSEKEKLDALGAHLVGQGPAPDLYLFSRGGFEPRLAAAAKAEPRMRLIEPADLWARLARDSSTAARAEPGLT